MADRRNVNFTMTGFEKSCDGIRSHPNLIELTVTEGRQHAWQMRWN